MKEYIIERFKIIEGMNSIIDGIIKSGPVELTFNFKKKISREVAEDIISQCIELEYGRVLLQEELRCLLDYETPVIINERPISKNDVNKIISKCMAELDECIIEDCIYTL